jgi:hypothetical protein
MRTLLIAALLLVSGCTQARAAAFTVMVDAAQPYDMGVGAVFVGTGSGIWSGGSSGTFTIACPDMGCTIACPDMGCTTITGGAYVWGSSWLGWSPPKPITCKRGHFVSPTVWSATWWDGRGNENHESFNICPLCYVEMIRRAAGVGSGP